MSVLTFSTVYCSKKVNMNLHINVIYAGTDSFCARFILFLEVLRH